jgi:nicotinamide-nucleotide amidase
VGIATTGVAGPEPQDGKPVGTVCIAVVTPGSTTSVTEVLRGDRASIRAGAAEAAITAALRIL